MSPKRVDGVDLFRICDHIHKNNCSKFDPMFFEAQSLYRNKKNNYKIDILDIFIDKLDTIVFYNQKNFFNFARINMGSITIIDGLLYDTNQYHVTLTSISDNELEEGTIACFSDKKNTLQNDDELYSIASSINITTKNYREGEYYPSTHDAWIRSLTTCCVPDILRQTHTFLHPDKKNIINPPEGFLTDVVSRLDRCRQQGFIEYVVGIQNFQNALLNAINY